ncbi:indolepyruvate oxidoreductase subunit beta [Metallumcola ferriviriculae]|uniref:Indolepyruvate oxidoreductase subunit beta n=1 Tax=Metallumcola ferriviriculae TaxID=3039180 RepID=A0AAU0UJI5_9FIRM|nr:indolepyruvate oxidoreductase subunit beta [Desulfitibacteraceae bacterium MK1]
MNKPVNILIVGVGGQGTVLASKILAQVALEIGSNVKVSEIHGMSQRGGSVVTQVRFGEQVYSPIIKEGGADVILAFEKLEALRWQTFLAPGGHMIVNAQEIDPMPVIMGAVSYPNEIIEQLDANADKLTVVDALPLAADAGNIKAANVVLLGVLAKSLGIDREVWLKALEATVPARFLDVNKKAFEKGFGQTA